MSEPMSLDQAVDALLKPRTVKLLREAIADTSGWTDREIELATATKTEVPSLWDQLTDAVATGQEQQSGRAAPDSKPPLDLDIRELLAQIREETHRQLRHYGLDPRPAVPDAVRQLAARLASDSMDEQDWWAYRISQWVRIGRRALGADALPQPRRIRDTACPTCQADHVTLTVDGERLEVPALLIDMQDGLVRAAECSACGASWFRGDQLHELGHTLGTARCCGAA